MRTKRECHCGRVRHVHGTPAMYDQDGCRCMACALAWAAFYRQWKAGDPARIYSCLPVHGTRRRLQALTLAGYSPPELATHTGLNDQVILRLRDASDQRRVMPATATVIAEAYDRLWSTPATGMHRRRMTNLARRKGYQPAMAWDDDTIDDPDARPVRDVVNLRKEPRAVDEVAVERIMAGTLKVPLMYSPGTRKLPAELVEAVRRLAARGLNDAQIGQRVGRTVANVLKIRERNSIPAGVREAAA